MTVEPSKDPATRRLQLPYISSALKFEQAVGNKFAAGVAEMDFGVSAPIIEDLTVALSSRQLGYLEPTLARSTIDACSDWLGRNCDWDVDPESIGLISDAAGGIRVAYEVAMRLCGAVIHEDPVYPRLSAGASSVGLSSIGVPFLEKGGRYVHDLDRLELELMRSGGPSVIVLCNPHNPTGSVASREELRQLSRLVDRYSGLVISDEVHAPLVYSRNIHIPYATVSRSAAEHSITLFSASKGWNISGLKCAQVIIPNSKLRDFWSEAPSSEFVSNGVSRLGAVATKSAYLDRSAWRDSVISELEGNAQALSQIGTSSGKFSVVKPQGSFMAWIGRTGNVDPQRTARARFERVGAFVEPGHKFSKRGAGFVRLNFGMPRSMLDQLLAAL